MCRAKEKSRRRDDTRDHGAIDECHFVICVFVFVVIVVGLVVLVVVVVGYPSSPPPSSPRKRLYQSVQKKNLQASRRSKYHKSPATSNQIERQRESETEPAQPRRGIGSQPHFD